MNWRILVFSIVQKTASVSYKHFVEWLLHWPRSVFCGFIFNGICSWFWGVVKTVTMQTALNFKVYYSSNFFLLWKGRWDSFKLFSLSVKASVVYNAYTGWQPYRQCIRCSCLTLGKMRNCLLRDDFCRLFNKEFVTISMSQRPLCSSVYCITFQH